MTGIILFRAQPFHNGHLTQIVRAVIDMIKLNSTLYVIVGSADKSGTRRNPFPIDLRLDLINNTLDEELKPELRQRVKVVPLDDLNDEANNTYSWGEYLYEALSNFTGDTEFVFYYSDKPEIVLSWFDEKIRNHFWFRFLDRAGNINATSVRIYLKKDLTEVLSRVLPRYVFEKREILQEYLKEVC